MNASPDRHGERGAATAEFGLVLPILILLLLAVVDFGRMVAVHAAAVTASREGARYGAAIGPGGSGDPQYIDCTGIKDAVRRVTSGLITLGNDQIRVSYDNGSGVAKPQVCPPHGTAPLVADIVNLDRVIVEVTLSYQPLAPFVGDMVGPMTVVTIDRRTIVKGP